MSVDAAFLPTIMANETWEDPFLTGSRREVTDETGNAYHLQLIDIAGYGSNSSNIKFYNESEYLMSVGVNYKF